MLSVLRTVPLRERRAEWLLQGASSKGASSAGGVRRSEEGLLDSAMMFVTGWALSLPAHSASLGYRRASRADAQEASWW